MPNKWDDNEDLRVLITLETTPGELRKLVRWLHCKQLVGQLLPEHDNGDAMCAKVLRAAANEFGIEILALGEAAKPRENREPIAAEVPKRRGNRLKIRLDKTDSM